MVVSVALAEEPAELVKLRKTWENSQAEAKKSAETIFRTKNIKANKLYHEELQEMKKNFMTDQNLQAAVAVDNEIKKLVALHGKQRFEAPKEEKKKSPSAKQQTDEEAFLEGAWEVRDLKNNSWGIYVFKGKSLKVFRYGKWLGGVHGYTIKDGVVTRVWGKDGEGWDKLTIDMKNPNQMHIVNSYGTKAIATRLKW